MHGNPEDPEGAVQWLDASAFDEFTAFLVDSLPLTGAAAQSVLVRESRVVLGRTTATENTNQLEAWQLSESTGRFTLQNVVPLASPAEALFGYDGLVAVQSGRSLDLVGFETFEWFGRRQAPACLSLDLPHADGLLASGLWVPLRDYGVVHFQAGGAPGSP